MPQDTETFELSDITVDTLGLVTQGANREEFFLLKSALEEQLDGENSSEVSETHREEVQPTRSFWQRFLKLFQKAVVAELNTLDQEQEVTKNEEEQEEGGQGLSLTTTVESTMETPSEVVTVVEQSPTTEIIHKEAQAMDEMTALEKAALEGRLAELEKANANLAAEIAKANEERDRQTFIAKAREYVAVPVSPVELGARLHALAKWDQSQYTFWSDLLKSVDALAGDAQLFVERGTARYEEQPTALDAVLKAADPREAILKMSRADADSYLKSMRARIRTAKEG